TAAGFTAQLGRWWRARDVLGAPPRPHEKPRAPVILVAVDTSRPDDPRHPSIQWTTRQVISLNVEYRLMCVSVVAAPGLGAGADPHGESGQQLEHLGRLRRWVEPLGLPSERLSLHVLQAPDASTALLAL